MVIIGVTQRTFKIDGREETFDCLEQGLVNNFSSNKIMLTPLSNTISNIEEYSQDLNLSGFILSGGNSLIPNDPDYSLQRNTFEFSLLDYAAKTRLPVVGICHGFQIMNAFFKGSLSKTPQHAGSQHKINVTPTSKQNLQVNSFHNYGIKDMDLGRELVPFASAEDGTIEGAYHITLPWIGIMWHPERQIPNQDKWIDILKAVLENPQESISLLLNKNL